MDWMKFAALGMVLIGLAIGGIGYYLQWRANRGLIVTEGVANVRFENVWSASNPKFGKPPSREDEGK